MATRPFRAPHHTISDAGLVGGGSTPAPGEISLGHNGVLFLDELPEFNRRTLEVLRQPLEDGTVTISRALSSTTFPANFMLIAALNPCPCGYRNDPRRDCHCTVPQIERYMSKISGPLLDRIDIHIEVPAVPFRELSGGDARHVERGRCAPAWWRPARSSSGASPARATRHNGQMTHRQIRQFCRLDDAGMNLLRATMTELGLSARAHDKILRLARTIADLDEQRRDRAGAPERGDQLPDAGSEFVDLGGFERFCSDPVRTDSLLRQSLVVLWPIGMSGKRPCAGRHSSAMSLVL